MAKADAELFFNSLDGCSQPSVSFIAPFATTAIFSIYEAGATLSAVSDSCIDRPVFAGTLTSTVDLSGILPVFLSSDGIMYDYPALNLTTPTIGYLVVTGVVNGAIVTFTWYQVYNPADPWPPPEAAIGFAALCPTALNAFSLGSADALSWPGPYVVSPAGGASRLSYFNDLLLCFGTAVGGHYSADHGANWTPLPTPIQAQSQSAQIGASSMWVVHTTDAWKTLDGITWNLVAIASFGSNVSIGGHEALVILGDNAGRINYSTDNQNFSGAVDVGLGPDSITAVSRSYGVAQPFVLIGNEEGELAKTTDGVSWTHIAVTSPFTTAIRCIIYAGGKYVATGDDGVTAWSLDGVTWNITMTGVLGKDIVYATGRYVFGGANGSSAPVIYTSPDAINWTEATNSFTGDSITALSPIY